MVAADINWAEAAENGLYTVPAAARLLAAKPAKIRSWVEGLRQQQRAPHPCSRCTAPRWHRRCCPSSTWLRARFVRHFLAIGYSPQTIRKVALRLRQRHHVDHPFAMNKRFKADGKSIFEEFVSDEGERRLVNLMNDNFELVPMVDPSLFEQVFYVDDLARRWTPLPAHGRVVIDPKIAFGRPVVDKIWIPTETFVQGLSRGRGHKRSCGGVGASSRMTSAWPLGLNRNWSGAPSIESPAHENLSWRVAAAIRGFMSDRAGIEVELGAGPPSAEHVRPHLDQAIRRRELGLRDYLR